MKRMTLAVVVLTMSCGGGSKNTPKPIDGTGGGMGDGEPEAVAVADPVKAEPPAPPDEGGYKLVAPSARSFTPLMEGGPEIAPVAGDLKTGGAFFLKLASGHNPGLHTHTADYHAVVISGTPRHWLPGGDKKAKPLAAGDYWFQPGGQPHGDHCASKEPCVLFVIMPGPFDFAPAPKAKAGKPGNYKLVHRKDIKFTPADPTKPAGMKIAVVHGDPKTGPVGVMLEVPANGSSGLHHHTSDYHALVLDGTPAHWLPHHANEGEPVEAGTYWFQPGGYDHGDRCAGAAPCHAFIYMDKAMDFLPPKAK